MLNKYSAAAKISFIAFFASISGFIIETIGGIHSHFLRVITELFLSLNLHGFSSFHSEDAVINQLFYLLLLLGAILFVTSGQRETRLIRFVFSLVFISRIVLTLVIIIDIIAIPRPDLKSFWGILGEVYFFVIQAFWIYIAYRILKYFNRIKVIDATKNQYGEIFSTEYNTATSIQRLFHLIADSVMAVMLFFWVIEQALHTPNVRDFLFKLQDTAGPKPGALLIIVFFRGGYYLLNEGLFGTTPAKLLTESRVITDVGLQPDGAAIARRTASRFVPFEAFSFFGPVGWHDKWSDTMVVKEVRTGVRGRFYFWIIPAAIVLIFINSIIQTAYREYKYKQRYPENEVRGTSEPGNN